MRALLVAAMLVMGLGPAVAQDQRFTNGFLTVFLFLDPRYLGFFTIQTGLSHPIPQKRIFYNGPTSYFTLLDYTANPQELWLPRANDWEPADEFLEGRIPRYMIELPDNPAILEVINPLSFRTTYTIPNFVVTQDVFVKGASLSSSFVQHTVSVKNTSSGTRSIGLRIMWDYMISASDNALFRTRLPDSDYTPDFVDFVNHCFAWYEMTDSVLMPTFTVFGTSVGGKLDIPPVPAEEVRYAGWNYSFANPWSFSNTGSEADSSVVYYWGKQTPIPVAPGDSVSFTQYVTTAPEMVLDGRTLDMDMQIPEFTWNGDDFSIVNRLINAGNMPIEDIVVVDTLPAEMEFVSATGSPRFEENMAIWEIESLGVGMQLELGLNMRVPEDFPAGEVTNRASATYWKLEYCSEKFPTIERSASMETGVSLPCSLSVTKQAPGSVEAGDVFDYSLNVKNYGEGTAFDVIITDTLPPVLSFVSAGVQPEIFGQLLVWRLDFLEPGGEFDVDYSVLSPRSYLDTELVNRAQAVGNELKGTRCVTGSGGAPVFVSWNPRPAQLNIEKAGPESVGPQDEFDYSISVENLGIGSAWDLVISDTLPAQFELVSASGSPETDGNLLVWRMDYLAPGAARQFNVRMKVPGIYDNFGLANLGYMTGLTESETGIVRATGLACATVFIHWEPKPALLEMEKTAPAVVPSMQEFDYLLTVMNSGTGSAWDLVITDTLPPELSFVSASGSPEIHDNLLVWHLDSLAAGAETQFTVRAKAPQTYSDLELANSSLVTGLTESETGIVRAAEVADAAVLVHWDPKPAQLKIEKTAPGAVEPGQEFEYLITVGNSGIGPVWDLVIADTLPAPLSLISASGSPEIYGNLLVWRLADLPAGGTYQVGARVRGLRSYSDLQVVNVGLLTGWTETETGIGIAAAQDAATVLLQKEAMVLRAFPNPFDRMTAVRGTLKFEGIMPGSLIRIYTVRGLKVWESKVQAAYRIEWDGRGEGGQPVAPGTYIWIVESEDTKQRGTLIVK